MSAFCTINRVGRQLPLQNTQMFCFFGRTTRRNSRSLTVTDLSYHCRKTKKVFYQSQQTQLTQLTNQNSRKGAPFQCGKKRVVTSSTCSAPDWPFARSGHMVENHSCCGNTNCTLGLQSKCRSRWTGKSCFGLGVPLCNVRPSV